MPSLSALSKFKSSFDDIGGQRADLRAKGISPDDFGFPDVEPPPMVIEKKSTEDVNEFNYNIDEDLLTPDSSPDPADEFDFSAFLGTQLDDISVEEHPEESPVPAFDEEQTSADNGTSLDLNSLDNFDPLLADFPGAPVSAVNGEPVVPDDFNSFNIPEDSSSLENSFSADGGTSLDLDSLDNFDPLFTGFHEVPVSADSSEPIVLGDMTDFEIPDEAAPVSEDEFNLDGFDIPEETTPVSADDFSLDSLDGFDIPEETTSAGTDDFSLDSLDGFDIPEEPTPAGADDFSLDSLDGLDIPEETTLAGADDFSLDSLDGFDIPEEPTPAGADDFSLDSLDGLDIPEEPTPADSSESINLDDLAESDIPDEQAAIEDDDQSFGIGEFDSEFSNFDPDAGVGKETGGDDIFGEEIDISDTDDFHFPDLDDIDADRPSRSPGSISMFGGKAKARAAAGAGAPVKNIESIQLTDEELKYLEETLSGYPLNLRIACEEVIAEQDLSVTPDQMSRLIRNLIRNAPARETAAFVSQLLGRKIVIPRSFQKSSGADLEAEQSSFGYIFIHKFLPVFRLFAFIAAVAGSVFYLSYRFVYTPLRADSIYKLGLERIYDGEYQRANERFTEAFNIHRRKNWFYRYAEAFRDERQFIYAEQKYEELLRFYPRDKKGVLDYAYMETYYRYNYAKADNLLQRQLLDFAPDDFEGLLASGDNSLAWGEIEPARYDDARFAYARLLELYGWDKNPQVVERMMLYFIRTDNLKETLYLREWFDANTKRKLSAATLAELGGYLLDKQLEETRGVPDEYLGQIDNVRSILLESVYADPSLPESHYHLSRYYHSLGNTHEERVTLEQAIRAFDNAQEESIRRLNYRINAHQRLADNLISTREFIPAEEQLVRGVNLYDNAIARRLLSPSPQYGRLHAGLGDLEYFTKTGDMESTLRHYHRAQQNGWAPPEMQYRMGSAYYQLEDWSNAQEYLFAASSRLPHNRRILYALGNAAFKQGNYFAAQGYYSRLLDILEVQRARLPLLLPNDLPEFL